MDRIPRQQIKELNRRRWIVWIPLAFALLASYFHRTATGIVADKLMWEFSFNRAADIGGLASIYFYIYAVMQLPAGILVDKFGPRRTVFLALTTATLGAVIFGTALNIPMLYMGRILSSFGVALIFICIVKIYAEWFRAREFTSMIGLVAVAGSSGFLLAATPLAVMVDHFGWRIAFMTIGIYTALTAVACWLWVKDHPADLGLPSISEVEAEEGTIRAIVNTKSVHYRVWDGLKIVMGNRATWWPFLASTAGYGVYMAFMGLWAVPYFMQVYQMTRVAASNYIMAMSIGMMVGAPLIGVLSDRLAIRRLPNVIFYCGFLLFWLILTLWNGGKPQIWALYPLCFGIGLAMSGMNLNVACGKEVTPPAMTGMVAGLVNSGAFIGAALMQPLFGWMLDCHWRGVVDQGVRVYPLSAYQYAFRWCAVVLMFGLFFTCLIKETHGINISGEKRNKLRIDN